MHPFRLHVLCYHVFIFSCLFVCCISGDRETLVNFNRSAKISAWRGVSLNGSLIPHCWWQGVICKERQNQPGIFFLAELRLSSFHISGAVSMVNLLAPLSTVRIINLGGNNLSGTLPVLETSSGSFLSLETLTLSYNPLSGTIPDFYPSPQLRKLKQLALRGCGLDGSLPRYNSSTSLKRIDFSRNRMTGSIPLSYCTWSALEEFNISYGTNKFVGSFANCMFELPLIEVIDIRQTGLSGALRFPALLPRMTRLFVSHNMFNFLEWPQYAPHLIAVDISHNPFGGFTTPVNLSTCGIVEEAGYVLQDVSIPIPALGGFGGYDVFLRVLSAWNKAATRMNSKPFLPALLWPGIARPLSRRLTSFRADNAGISGAFIQSGGEAFDAILEEVQIEDLGFGATLPGISLDILTSEFTNIRSMLKQSGVFDLIFPAWLSPFALPQLEDFSVASNSISSGIVGTPVHSGDSIPRLQSVDLSYNELTGVIPWSFFASLKLLAVLSLQHNQFRGPLFERLYTKQSKSFPVIRTLDVSDNPGLHGKPISLAAPFLSYLNISRTLMWSDLPADVFAPTWQYGESFHTGYLGIETVEEVATEPILTTIDFSSTYCQGNVPVSVWTLPNLRHLILRDTFFDALPFHNFPRIRRFGMPTVPDASHEVTSSLELIDLDNIPFACRSDLFTLFAPPGLSNASTARLQFAATINGTACTPRSTACASRVAASQDSRQPRHDLMSSVFLNRIPMDPYEAALLPPLPPLSEESHWVVNESNGALHVRPNIAYAISLAPCASVVPTACMATTPPPYLLALDYSDEGDTDAPGATFQPPSDVSLSCQRPLERDRWFPLERDSTHIQLSQQIGTPWAVEECVLLLNLSLAIPHVRSLIADSAGRIRPLRAALCQSSVLLGLLLIDRGPSQRIVSNVVATGGEIDTPLNVGFVPTTSGPYNADYVAIILADAFGVPTFISQASLQGFISPSLEHLVYQRSIPFVSVAHLYEASRFSFGAAPMSKGYSLCVVSSVVEVTGQIFDVHSCVEISARPCEPADFSVFSVQSGRCMVAPDVCSESLRCYGTDVVHASPGYWRASSVVFNAERCIRPESCPGEEYVDENICRRVTAAGSPCMQGYKGILCADCCEGYLRKNPSLKCEKCSDYAVVYVGVYALIVFGCMFIVAYYLAKPSLPKFCLAHDFNNRHLDCEKVEYFSRRNCVPLYTRLLMNTCQSYFMISLVSTSWPPSFDYLWVPTRMLLPFYDNDSFLCIWPQLQNFFSRTLILWASVFSMVVVFVLFHIIIVKPRIRDNLYRTCFGDEFRGLCSGLNAILLMCIFSAYQPLTINAMAIFGTHTVRAFAPDSVLSIPCTGEQAAMGRCPNPLLPSVSKDIIVADVAVDPDSADMIDLRILSAFALVFGTIGIPLVLLILMRWSRKHLRMWVDSRVLRSIGLLYVGYRPEVYLFELFFFFRKLLSCAIITSVRVPVRATFMLLLVGLELLVHAPLQPYENRNVNLANRCWTLSLISQIFLIAAVLVGDEVSSPSTVHVNSFFAIGVILMFLVFVAFIFGIVYEAIAISQRGKAFRMKCEQFFTRMPTWMQIHLRGSGNPSSPPDTNTYRDMLTQLKTFYERNRAFRSRAMVVNATLSALRSRWRLCHEDSGGYESGND